MKNEDPFELTDDYIVEVGVAMEHLTTDNGTIKNVLLAERDVRRRIIDDPNTDRWRDVYSFHIPNEVLIDMLRTVAWATMDEFGEPSPLVTFYPITDPEDSYFQVLDNDGDLKDSLPDAIKKAFFRLKDDQKTERRRKYEQLKKEFEP